MALLGLSGFLSALPDQGCGVSPSNESPRVMWALGKSGWISQVAGLSHCYDSQVPHLIRPREAACLHSVSSAREGQVDSLDPLSWLSEVEREAPVISDWLRSASCREVATSLGMDPLFEV